jgi:protein tyrosine phosphatase
VVLKDYKQPAAGDEVSDAPKDFLDYINANYVNSFIKEKGEKAFIATQAPLENTLDKFWQMIWEHKTRLIIMLCPFIGPKGDECIKYFPSNEDKEMKVGNLFTLKLIKYKKDQSLTKIKI